MATTYAPNFALPRDRVRRMVADTGPAKFDLSDEEIYYALTDSGYVGDPTVEGPKQETPELLASIALVESIANGSTESESTVRLGDQTYTEKGGAGTKDRSGILRALYARLRAQKRLLGGGAPAVADGYDCSVYPVAG